MPADRILIADDDRAASDLIAAELAAAGYVVEQVERGDDADSRLETGGVDLLVLNWVLPAMSGAALCQRSRQRSVIPIIVLAESAAEEDKIRAFDAGADDYLVKPPSLKELIARVHAVLRRARNYRSDAVEVIGGIVFETGARRVSRNGRDIHLGPLERGLLSFLMTRPGQIFSREQLLEAVWPEGTTAASRTVDVQLARLRRALSVEGEADPIANVRGIGYAFLADFDRRPSRKR